MANIRRWMAEARALEEAGDLRGAVALHQKALAAQEETAGFADLGLYNGLGDLYLRAGEVSRAVAAFEKATEVCEEQQLYTNGIALCKKILRNAPEHAGAHRRAGRLLAASGLSAEARAHYEHYVDLAERSGRPDRAEEALEELVSLTGDEGVCLTLADRLVEDGRTEAALRVLRETRDRREEAGRDVVAIVRRIQEIGPADRGEEAAKAPRAETPPAHAPRPHRIPSESRPGTDPSGEADAPPPAEAAPPEAAESRPDDRSSGATPDPSPGRPGPAPSAEDEVAGLMAELEDALGGLDAPERFQQALRILDQLLELQPDRFELLHRKLGCAFALGDEAATVEAYLALGAFFDRRLRAFSIRSLSSSSVSGGVTTALRVALRSEEAGTGL